VRLERRGEAAHRPVRGAEALPRGGVAGRGAQAALEGGRRLGGRACGEEEEAGAPERPAGGGRAREDAAAERERRGRAAVGDEARGEAVSCGGRRGAAAAADAQSRR
jgi:hypothetical protein